MRSAASNGRHFNFTNTIHTKFYNFDDLFALEVKSIRLVLKNAFWGSKTIFFWVDFDLRLGSVGFNLISIYVSCACMMTISLKAGIPACV